MSEVTTAPVVEVARAFFEATTRLLSKDIYAWLEAPPSARPWQV